MRDAKVKETEAQRIARLRAIRKAEDVSYIKDAMCRWVHPFLPVKLIDRNAARYPDNNGIILMDDITTVIIGNMFDPESLKRGKVQKFNSVEELTDVWTVD